MYDTDKAMLTGYTGTTSMWELSMIEGRPGFVPVHVITTTGRSGATSTQSKIRPKSAATCCRNCTAPAETKHKISYFNACIIYKYTQLFYSSAVCSQRPVSLLIGRACRTRQFWRKLLTIIWLRILVARYCLDPEVLTEPSDCWILVGHDSSPEIGGGVPPSPRPHFDEPEFFFLANKIIIIITVLLHLSLLGYFSQSRNNLLVDLNSLQEHFLIQSLVVVMK